MTQDWDITQKQRIADLETAIVEAERFINKASRAVADLSARNSVDHSKIYAEAIVDGLPVRKRCAVHAAIRQARELPSLAREFPADEVLLEAVHHGRKQMSKDPYLEWVCREQAKNRSMFGVAAPVLELRDPEEPRDGTLDHETDLTGTDLDTKP